jgi:hypothetical protein
MFIIVEYKFLISKDIKINPSSHTMALWSTQAITERVLGTFLRVKGGWQVMVTAPPPCGSRLRRKSGSLEVSRPYDLPSPITGISLPF